MFQHAPLDPLVGFSVKSWVGCCGSVAGEAVIVVVAFKD
jgi:hypothetical protein